MRTRLLTGLSIGFAAAISISFAACGSDDDCGDTGSCGKFTGGAGGKEGGLGGTGGAGGKGGSSADGGGGTTACDKTKSPSEEACLVADEHGVFVAPTGS